MSTAAEEPSPIQTGTATVRCPMCGATVDKKAPQCLNCGEELQVAAKGLTVPLYSMTAIGLCTFLWSFATGMVLVWLNCRRLERHSAANRTLLLALAMLTGLIVATRYVPDDLAVSLMIAVFATLLVTSYAKSVMKDAFEKQREQGGPYRSIWLAHALGLIVMLLLIVVLLGVDALIDFIGVES